MSSVKVSLVVITKNEEENIARCIESAKWVDEIIVLDSQSTDKTVSIAENLGAKTFVEPFRGYTKQKQRAVELASFDWILSLDADEALSPELSNKLKNLVKNNDLSSFSFCMPRKSYYLGRWILHGGWFPDRQTRFFNRKNAQWTGGETHERVEGKDTINLDEPILHWVFKEIADQVDTNNEYSGKGALDLIMRGKSFSLFKLCVKPPFKFLETYVFKRGFLDGLPGFIISISAAYSMFLKYAKLWERNFKDKKPQGDEL